MTLELRHGSHCGCRVLEAAAQVRFGTISCAFCKSVLQKRWRMTCNHGEPPEAEKPVAADRWAGIGALRGDAVKAILVAEGLAGYGVYQNQGAHSFIWDEDQLRVMRL